MNKNIAKILMRETSYMVSAIGHRDVGVDELGKIINIIKTSSVDEIADKLNNLYKYHPDTISLSKSSREDCPEFIEEFCDCYLPDVEFENCYCRRLRKERLQKTDYRNTPEYRNWRTAVFERDNYTCQDCKQVGGVLNAHHIKPFKKYPKERYVVSNGVTLCIDCHRLRHKKVIK